MLPMLQLRQFEALRAESDTARQRLQEFAAVEADKAAMARQLDALRAEHEGARVQVVRLAKELARLRQEERERASREMEKLKVEYLAREEKYVLDGDRATLRDIRQQLENLSRTGSDEL